MQEDDEDTESPVSALSQLKARLATARQVDASQAAELSRHDDAELALML